MRRQATGSERQIYTGFAVAQLWVVTAAVVVPAFVVGPPDAVDGIVVVKAVVVVLAGVGAFALAASAAGRAAKIVVANDPAIVAASAFVSAFIVATALSQNPPLSISGDLPRWNGLALYAACAVLFVAATTFTPDAVRTVLQAVTVAGLALGSLALADALDLHQFGGAAANGARATLGNPNFLGAWLAIAVPICVALALDHCRSRSQRRLAAAAALAAGAGTVGSLALQAPLAAAVGLSVVGLVWLRERLPAPQVRAATVAVILCGATALVGGVLGAQGVGPASRLAQQTSVEHRGYYWHAAVSMLVDEPFMGKGPGHFEPNYRIHRPLEDALASPLEDSADAAHSVPLDMAVAGGAPLLVAYLSWLGFVGWRLWRGLSTVEGRDRLLLGGVGGAWLAYVAQSLVSIDVPPLAVLGWVLGGMVIALASKPQVWELSLPWPAQTGGRKRSVPTAARILDGAGVLVGVVLLWFVLLPMRADAGATQAALTPSGAIAPDSGLAQAARIADWEPAFGMQMVEAYMVIGDTVNAQKAAVDLATRIPTSFDASLTAARLAAENGDVAIAARMYGQTLDIEPQHPDAALEVARFAQSSGDTEWARALVHRVLEADPSHGAAIALASDL